MKKTLQFFRVLKAKDKEMDRRDKAGNQKADEIFTEVIPWFISDFQQ